MKLIAFVLCLYYALAAPIADSDHFSTLSYQTIYEFPNGTWVENIAVRSNGNLLVTLITKAEVWEIDPFKKTARLAHHFPNAFSGCGIAEVEHDLFAVAIGDWNDTTFQGKTGSWSVWNLDYRSGSPKASKITNIHEAGFLNGLTNLPFLKDHVLVGDAKNGVIYLLNTKTGKYSTPFDSLALKPNTTAAALLGVNGIHFYEDEGKPYLYFSNSFSHPTIGRFLLNDDGTPASSPETVLDHATYPLNIGYAADDFAIDKHGIAWVNSDVSNTLVTVDLHQANPVPHIVAGGVNDTLILGDTAAAFGRTGKDSAVLYVTTNGGLAYPPPSGYVGGKIVAFNTDKHHH